MDPVEQSWRNQRNSETRKGKSKPSNSSDDNNSMTTSRSASNRLYLAPQSTIRRMDSSDLPKAYSGTRRRRHKHSSLQPHSPDSFKSKQQSNHNNTGYQTDSSHNSGILDEEMGGACNVSLSSHHFASPARSLRRNKYRRRNQTRKQHSIPDLSVDLCDAENDAMSVYTSVTHHSSRSDKPRRARPTYSKKSNKLRLLCGTTNRSSTPVMLPCAPYTSNKKSVHSRTVLWQAALFVAILYGWYRTFAQLQWHRDELHRYETERAHILEQMTWIDHAAKKVHQHYHSSNHHGQLQALELRVQQNSRYNLEQIFGSKPVQVSLTLPENSDETEHLVIALSDDAPHAVQTFVQQVHAGHWDHINVENYQPSDSDEEAPDNGMVLIQASTEDLLQLHPVLEFVEQSRGCQAAGSVSLQSLESDQLQILVLKVRLKDASTTVTNENDVCIGTVLKGLYDLEQMLPMLPVVHDHEGSRPF